MRALRLRDVAFLGGTSPIQPVLNTGGFSNSGTTKVTNSHSPKANGLIIVAVVTNTSTTPTIAGNGITWKLANKTEIHFASASYLYVWVGKASSPTVGAVTITNTGASASWQVMEIENGSVVQTTGAVALTKTFDSTFQDPKNGTVAIIGSYQDTTNATGGLTTLSNSELQATSRSLHTAYKIGEEATVTFTSDLAQVTNAVFILEIDRVVSLSTQLTERIMKLTPLGYWPCNDLSGGVVTDHSGNARHGTYTGVTVNGFTVNGSPYPSFAGDGASYLDFGDRDEWSMNTAPGLTFFCVMNPTNYSHDASWLRSGIITKAASDVSQVEYWWGWYPGNNPGALGLYLASSNGTNFNYEQTQGPAAGIAAGSWGGFAVSRASGAQASFGTTKHYRNSGSPIGIQFSSNGALTYTNGTAPMRFGHVAQSQGAGKSFLGGAGHICAFAGQKSNGHINGLMTAASMDGWF